jgi:hypothetical protein
MDHASSRAAFGPLIVVSWEGLSATGSLGGQMPRHCERSEAIQLSSPQQQSWIASSLRSSQ